MNALLDSGPHSEPAPPAPEILYSPMRGRQVGELIREEANPNLKLRVFVSGGGCSGFQYGFTFDEAVEDGDFCIEMRACSCSWIR